MGGNIVPRYNILVKGEVQGVGFRYFVQLTAKDLGLTGWVKNLDNGNVQMEIQNTTCDIGTIVEKLKNGNRFSKVKEIEYEIVQEIPNEKSFKILY